MVNVPGPTGPAGTSGTNGTNGVNAYCTTTAQFTVPNVNFTVTLSVDSTSFLPASPGGAYIEVYVGNAGYFEVISFTSNSILVKNIQAVPASTVVPLGQKVSIAGPRGLTGTAGGGAPSTSTYILQTADASLPSAQVLSTLTTGYAKVTNGTGAITTVSTIPASAISGLLSVSQGATGISGYAIGDMLTASGSSSLNRLSPGTAGYPIVSNGVGAQPGYAQLNLGVGATGVLNISNGGTGSTTAAGAKTALGLNSAFNPQYLNVYFASQEYISVGGITAGLANVIFNSTQISTTVSYQSENAFGTNGAYTPTTSGYYHIEVSLQLSPGAGTHYYVSQVILNGSTAAPGITARLKAVSTYPITMEFGGIVYISNPGSNSIQVGIYCETGAVNTYLEKGSRFTITKISP
ncbi:MAG: hypothetical protein WCG75_00035 [Armatimonadota bacterium]